LIISLRLDGIEGGHAHVKVDTEPLFIGAVATITALVHDSTVDLDEVGEVRYGDKAHS